MKTKLIVGGIFFFILIIGGFFLLRPQAEAPVLSDPATAERTVIEYVNDGDTARVQVGYRGDTVLLNGLSFTDVLLERVETASGVRYQNTDNSIAFWTKGDDATIYVNTETIFVGTDSSVLIEPEVEASPEVITEATSTEPVLTGTWVWDSSTAPSSTTTSDFTLTFGISGSLRGTTDCNNFSGTYTATGTTLSIGPLAMTKKFCEGSLETEFTTPLTGDVTFSIIDDTLTLLGSEGELTLTRN